MRSARRRSRWASWPDQSFLPRQSRQRSSDRFAKRSGNVDEEECVFGKRFIPALHFYCHLKDVFRLGFLTSSADHVLTTIMADEFFIGAESPDRGQRIFGKFSLSNVRTLMSRNLCCMESCLSVASGTCREQVRPCRRTPSFPARFAEYPRLPRYICWINKVREFEMDYGSKSAQQMCRQFRFNLLRLCRLFFPILGTDFLSAVANLRHKGPSAALLCAGHYGLCRRTSLSATVDRFIVRISS